MAQIFDYLFPSRLGMVQASLLLPSLLRQFCVTLHIRPFFVLCETIKICVIRGISVTF